MKNCIFIYTLPEALYLVEFWFSGYHNYFNFILNEKRNFLSPIYKIDHLRLN